MRWRSALAAVVLSACVTTEQQERAKVREAFPADRDHVQSLVKRLYGANRDLCPWNLCEVPVHVDYNGGKYAIYGVHAAAAWASFDGWIGLDGHFVGIAQHIGRRTGLNTDSEIALLIGHEWAHFLLGHVESLMSGAASSRDWEDAADCVGAVLAQRAGFDMAGGMPLTKLAKDEGPVISLYSPPKEQVAKVTTAARTAQDLLDQGKPLDKTAIRGICRVVW